MILISGILLFILSVVGNSIFDYRIWLRQLNKPKNVRNHKKGWYLKACSLIPSGICLTLASNFHLIPAIVSVGALLLWWFMLGFDGCYNLLRGEPFFSRGTEDGKDDPLTDNIWQKVPQWAHITLKIVFCGLTAAFYYIGLTK